MPDMEYPNVQQWSDEDPMSRQNLNRMIAEFRHLSKVEKLSEDNDAEGDPQAVNMGEFLERYIFNSRPEILGTTQIRIPFTADRPQTLMIDGFMLQGTTDINSAVYSGGANTIYVIAIRTVDSTTFTIALRTSATEGTDERLLGSVTWNGTLFEPGSIVSYETEGLGFSQVTNNLVKCWLHSDPAGNIIGSENVSTVVKDATGKYTITWDRDFEAATYSIVGSIEHPTTLGMFYILNHAAASVQIGTTNQAGNATDQAFSVMSIGVQV